MTDELIYVNDNTKNYPIGRLQLLAEKFGNSTNPSLIIVSKVVTPINNKCYYRTLGTSAINSPMSPHSLNFLAQEMEQEHFFLLAGIIWDKI